MKSGRVIHCPSIDAPEYNPDMGTIPAAEGDAWLRAGGVVVAEIHLRDDQPHQFVLEPGELWAEFHGWKILSYSEGSREAHKRPSAKIIARRA